MNSLKKILTAFAATLCLMTPPALAGQYVPVLMYHHLTLANEFPPSDVSVPLAKFKAQMAWLHQQGYKTLTAQQLVGYLVAGIPTTGKYVVIRFDDGWLSQLQALPVLKQYGYTASFYIIGTGPGSDPLYMSWTDVKNVDKAGHEIGAHSMTHQVATPESASQYEFQQSKQLIEGKIGHQVYTLAWPNGYYTNQLLIDADRYGYWGTLTLDEAWPNGHLGNGPNDDEMRLKSLYIDGNCGPNDFSILVTQMYTPDCTGK